MILKRLSNSELSNGLKLFSTSEQVLLDQLEKFLLLFLICRYPLKHLNLLLCPLLNPPQQRQTTEWHGVTVEDAPLVRAQEVRQLHDEVEHVRREVELIVRTYLMKAPSPKSKIFAWILSLLKGAGLSSCNTFLISLSPIGVIGFTKL